MHHESRGILRWKKYPKCCAMLFTRQAAIDPSSGPSNEIICILPAQGAAKLQKVKFEGLKKILYISVSQRFAHGNSNSLIL